MGDQATPVPAPRRKNEDGAGQSSREADSGTTWENFMKIHTQAYAATKEGQIFDEEGFKDKAFNSYEKALELIDKAIQVSYGGGFSTEEVNKVDEIVYKIRMTRKEILERISDLQHTPDSPSYLQGPGIAASAPPVTFAVTPTTSPQAAIASSSSGAIRQPPAYSQYPTSGQSSLTGSIHSDTGSSFNLQGSTSIPNFQNSQSLYSDLASALDEIAAAQSVMPNPLPLHAEEVFFIEKEVQLYYIGSDGLVSAPSYPSFLRIVVINKDYEPQDPTQPPAFIQCAEWTYPLVKNASPLFKSQDGTYLFPDLSSTDSGASVGLILPGDCSAEKKAQFEDTLLQLVGISSFPGPVSESEVEVEQEAGSTPPVPPTRRKLSTKIAEGVIKGAECISKGLQYGAEKSAVYLDKGASYLITKMDPAKKQTVISPEVKSTVKTAKTVTGKAVQVSGFLVNQLSKGTVMLGTYLAPHIQSGATKVYAHCTKTDEHKASKKVCQVMEVGGGVVTGISVVYNGLETAAKTLAASLANNTVQVVNHRYGTEAGVLAEDTAETVGNAVVTGLNAKMINPKAIVKRVAKDTGKATLTTKPGKGGHTSPEPSTSSSPPPPK